LHMLSKLVLSGILCSSLVFVMGCNPTSSSSSGTTTILTEGFEKNLSSWSSEYRINLDDPTYPQMRITTDAAHTGTHSLTSDSTTTALIYSLPNKLQSSDSALVYLQFYMMAKAYGEANFTVQIGQDAGSSGGLFKKFGFGFNTNDSIETVYFDNHNTDMTNNGYTEAPVSKITLNHWYKCVVEVNFTTKKVNYSIDDALVLSKDLPTSDMAHIDRLLVFRGATVDRPDYSSVACKEGVKQYYADDIVLYKK